MREIRYALRTFRRNSALSLIAVIVLALGIGANSAIFTVVRAVLLAPLPYHDPDRLVRLYERDVVNSNPYNLVSGANFFDWRGTAHSFTSMGLWGDWGSNFSPSDEGLPENLTGALCDAGLFRTLGAAPAIGRYFRDEDDRPDAERVVVIGASLWRQRFGGTAAVLGSRIRLDGDLYTVIGVMPPGFDFPSSTAQFWVPAKRVLNARVWIQRGNHRFNALARLAPGVSVAQARTELDGIARRIHEQHAAELTGKGANVASLTERMVGGVRPLLLVLLGAVICVLLIACVNVGNLLLARAVAARREVAIRAALGASWARIARQFLTESLLLSLGGAALGVLLAVFGTGVLIKMAGTLPRVDSVRVNGAVLAFTAGVAILTGIAVGLVPALTSSLGSLAGTIQAGARSTNGRGSGLVRDAIIALEVALSLVLLMGAGLMLKSFVRLRAVDPGFNPDRVLTTQFSLPPQQFKTPAAIAGFYRDLLDRVHGLPGVASAGLVTVAPLRGHYMDTTFQVDGRPPLPEGQFLDAVVRAADPGYFQAAGIPLKRGHIFTAAQWLEGANEAVITESMAKAFFPNEDPLGKRLRLTQTDAYEIVGIVGDTRQNLATAAEPMMYFPLYRGDYSFAVLLVRAAAEPDSLSLPLQKEMRRLDPDLPAVTVRTMEQIVAGSTQQSRFGLTLMALFAVLAMVLASAGLYGVLAYSVGRRTNEFGIRAALGADRGAITLLILRQGLTPVLAGIAAGIAGSLAGGRLIRNMLFESNPADPAVLAMVAGLLLLTTLAASLTPARRAARLDPMKALRTE